MKLAWCRRSDRFFGQEAGDPRRRCIRMAAGEPAPLKGASLALLRDQHESACPLKGNAIALLSDKHESDYFIDGSTFKGPQSREVKQIINKVICVQIG